MGRHGERRMTDRTMVVFLFGFVKFIKIIMGKQEPLCFLGGRKQW